MFRDGVESKVLSLAIVSDMNTFDTDKAASSLQTIYQEGKGVRRTHAIQPVPLRPLIATGTPIYFIYLNTESRVLSVSGLRISEVQG